MLLKLLFHQKPLIKSKCMNFSELKKIQDSFESFVILI